MVTLDLDEEDDEERSSWDVTLWAGAAAADRHAKAGLQQVRPLAAKALAAIHHAPWPMQQQACR